MSFPPPRRLFVALLLGSLALAALADEPATPTASAITGVEPVPGAGAGHQSRCRAPRATGP